MSNSSHAKVCFAVTTKMETTTFPQPSNALSVLLLGAGGREHALAYKLAQSSRVARVYVCPGNGGTAMMGGKVENVALVWGGKAGFGGVVSWAGEREVDLVVPGPEQPLVDGVELAFRKGESARGLANVPDQAEERQLEYLSLARRFPPRSSKDQNPSRNLSWPVTRSPPPPSGLSPSLNTPSPCSTSNRTRSLPAGASSRPRVSPVGRACCSPKPSLKLWTP